MGKLVLSRKLGEKIFIENGNDLIKITLLRVQGHQAALMIDADNEVKVHREEIYNKINS